MKKRKNIFVFILLVSIVLFVASFIYNNYLIVEKTYLNIELVYIINTENMKVEQLDEVINYFDAKTYYTTVENLNETSLQK